MNVEKNAKLKFDVDYYNTDCFNDWNTTAKGKEDYLEDTIPYENPSTLSFFSDSSTSVDDGLSEKFPYVEDLEKITDDDPYGQTEFLTSSSTPLNYQHTQETDASLIDCYYVSIHERIQFLKEIEQIREGISQFKGDMSILERQMISMELDLKHSKNRVLKVEEGLTVTQEVSVNLQILLEKSLQKQKKADKYATRTMQRIFSNLSTVVHETNRLKGKMIAIANHQKKRQGSADIIADRIREYMEMLEQAQETIHSLKHKRQRSSTATLAEGESSLIGSSKNEDIGVIYGCENKVTEASDTRATANVNTSHYRHRIIRKRASTPDMSGVLFLRQTAHDGVASSRLPQRGLRILLNDYRMQ
ncbi:hypothetical protein BDF20DRAFT_502919 [Mycotypha africana]|uniref:uncharacterized protein n=1 Tax=Mycotypha africana TaxID=64632 RepID=UPI002301E689|nr:uncharacterized protein BDF20DRAFT_502919 [Mycotypha africana]KAI8979401.1 hypothetical protein BDF20DRAFT_502919 [Mycotypha africana]